MKTQITNKDKKMFYIYIIFSLFILIYLKANLISKCPKNHTISSVTIHQSFDKIKSACFHYILLVLQRGCYDKDEKFSTKYKKILYFYIDIYIENLLVNNVKEIK